MSIMILTLLLLGGVACPIFLFLRSRGKLLREPGEDSLFGLSAPFLSNRPPLFSFLQEQIAAGISNLDLNQVSLPDEEHRASSSGVRWVAGGLDGAFGHHGGVGEDEESVKLLAHSIQSFLFAPDASRFKDLYETILGAPTLTVVDPLLEGLSRMEPPVSSHHLAELARWLITKSPDRAAVKLGCALIGICGSAEDSEILRTIGRHEEFTLYATVALLQSCEESELEIWNLAKNVHGWGRIHIVERLSQTQRPEIKDWLLREGFRNSILYEYTAVACATGGDLREALTSHIPDDEILESSALLLEAMIAGDGGPAEGLMDYVDGPEVCRLFLEQLSKRDMTLQQLLTVHEIVEFVKNRDRNWESLQGGEWEEKNRDWLCRLADPLISRAEWTGRIERALESEDELLFHTAVRLARLRKIDVWDFHYQRVKKGKNDWFYLMQTEDGSRVDKVISLAEERLPLDKIASGPSNSVGLGPEFQDHGALDSVLQELRKFPEKGVRLIQTGLRSPSIRNRNMALKALEGWGELRWKYVDPDTLRALLKQEPNESTRALIEGLLKQSDGSS